MITLRIYYYLSQMEFCKKLDSAGMLRNVANTKNRPVCLGDPLIISFYSLFINSLPTYPASYHLCKVGGGREMARVQNEY